MTPPQRLFVYGSLGPGQPNEHYLMRIGGTWTPATVRGRLLEEGWGAGMGFPGLVLDEAGPLVHGHIFESPALAESWPALDTFEGQDYVRAVTTARTQDGRELEVFVYAVNPNC